MADSQEGALTCKVVLIGESGVGKTSIISQFIEQNFSRRFAIIHRWDIQFEISGI